MPRDRAREVQLPVRVTIELRDKLRGEAAARGFSMTFFVQKLLEEGLDNLRPTGEWKLTRDPNVVEVIDGSGNVVRRTALTGEPDYICPNCLGRNGLHSGMDSCPSNPPWLKEH